MLDRLAKWAGAIVPANASPSLRRAAPIALSALLFAAIGLAWPLAGSPSPSDFSSSATVRPDMAVGDGGLDGFLAMARWGRPAYDAEAARRAREAAEKAARDAAIAMGLNEVLARLGVIGITSSGANHAVLLTRPDGTQERLTDGEALPDGRVLISVSANALVLEDADGGREELLLFPRLGGVAVAGEPPMDGEDAP